LLKLGLPEPVIQLPIDISQLRDDLQRLAFLLGTDNEDQLFGQ